MIDFFRMPFAARLSVLFSGGGFGIVFPLGVGVGPIHFYVGRIARSSSSLGSG